MDSNTTATQQLKIPVSCNRDCGGGCPLTAFIENGRITKITNSSYRSPYMTGCPVGFQAHRETYAPDRLKTPLIRTGARGSGEFRSISWDDALDRVADRLAELKSKYGAESILHLGGSGSCHGALHNTLTCAKRFLRLFGRISERFGGSYSVGATAFALPFLIGDSYFGHDPGTLQFSNLIILWGANTTDTRFGNETERWIHERKKQGIPVIVIEPRRSRTVERLGTQWIPVLPGTDTALMSAVVYVLIEENLVDEQFIDTYSIGFEELKRSITGAADGIPKTPDWAEEICGTPSSVIYDFARLYGRTKPAALMPGLSIQRTIGGEEAARMAVVLQTVTANIGVMGGSTGGYAWNNLRKPECGSLPVPEDADYVKVPGYRWPDAVLEGTKGGYPSDIKALYNVGGNFLSQGSDIRKNIKAFEKVDFSVCHELFLTPTARYCDIILPVTTALEREDILFPDNNYILYSHQAAKPVHDVKNDYDIFCELADKLGYPSKFSENRTKEEWLAHFLAQSEIEDIDGFKRTGIYKGKEHLRVGMSEFIADPTNNPLSTPSGLIEIASERYAETGFPAIPHCRILPTEDDYPLRLITPHARYRINSSCSSIPWFREREKQVLWINPRDAEKRGISDGQTVSVYNKKGTIRIAAWVTENIIPGVVCLLQGVWPEFDSENVETAGSVNILTSTTPTMPSQSSRTHSILVEVSVFGNER
ncbi:molybdopterin-dependent oxidoreductase [Candidatus Latescibacterota bacterium]